MAIMLAKLMMESPFPTEAIVTLSDPGCVAVIFVIVVAAGTFLEGIWSMWILIPLAAVMLLIWGPR